MVSAYFSTPPANELDERIAAGLLLLTGLTPNIKDPQDGVTIPPFCPTENYHFETKGPAVIVALSVCMVVLTLVTFLRLGIRLFVHGVRFGADDWLIIPAYLLSMAYPALQIAMVQYGGAGKHFYDITYQEYFYYKSLALSAATVFYVYVGLVKMSIALFNIRLTTLTTRFWKNVNWAFFVICTAYTFAALFLNVFKCTPQYASFNLLRIAESGKVPKCLSVNSINSILRLNLALDFTALAIPVIVLWKVQLSWKKKARIFGLLSIGLIACIASVMTLLSRYTLEKDPLWNYTTLLAWIMVELVVSLAAACAPTLAYLLPRSMFSKHYARNSASKLTGPQLLRNDYALRSRPVNREDRDSEEDERRIVVKGDIEIEWQDNEHSDAHGSQVSDYTGDDGILLCRL
ncbi:hypothetical protein P153DRAFT_346653 [Dothidotthia symphoricarpi CBS 119687]|uniref:Rhodopsin domain-containing protein n=1 Tax=Dothidotthia symphoricarpi CBS 119687 TaxID=1392245 RepID=A0A6A6A787_9PLEO|nr:uncharacterized protein P153DRAFT_346653 [Dothidotthia symphoricarpi CBS 119687]KAF2126667.1 hypothetical protein P153DRAFT_346653 [Dothidotthia symphoricarpi CBS 119687]